MTTVVTGWHPAGYDLYGRHFVETFDRHWPKTIALACYTETPVVLPCGECRSLWDCDGARWCRDHYSNKPEYCGRAPQAGWKDNERAAGYSYRFDAAKFFKQLLIPEHAAQTLPDGEILAWFDADVVTFKDVEPRLIENVLGNADLAYLGRDGKHSEIGFWAVQLNGTTRAFLYGIADMYRTRAVFDLREWHSAFVFDEVRVRFEKIGMKSKNLTPGGRGHVWFQSPLKHYTDHLKGKRKLAGRSKERGR